MSGLATEHLTAPDRDELESTMEEAAFWELIRGRRSIRRYEDRDVPAHLIWRVLTAAHWAPSAHNRQPWRFAVVPRGPRRERLAKELASRWVADLLRDGVPPEEAHARGARSIERLCRAPVLIVVALSMRDMDTYPDPRRQAAEHTMAVQSVAMAGQNLLLAAHHYGLGACWLCAPLFAPDVVRRVLELPQDWEPQGFVTIGYPAETRHKARAPLEERVIFVPEDA